MNDLPLIDPKEVKIEGADKTIRTFRIGRLPYLAGGRELCTQFAPTGMPKIGDYKVNEELARKMFQHVEAILPDGITVRLSADAFVHSHVPDFLTGMRLEAAALEHNLGFSIAVKMSGFLDQLLQAIQQSTSKILTALQEQSSAPQTGQPQNKS